MVIKMNIEFNKSYSNYNYFLAENNLSIGDTVDVKTKETQYVGILMNRYESYDKNHIVLKLKNGYNIGIQIAKIQSIKKSDNLLKSVFPNKSFISNVSENLTLNQELPKVMLLSTGGTIASKIDYRTGAVTGLLSASDLYTSVPELKNYASVDTEVILNEYSENIEPFHWTLITNKIAEKINQNQYSGIIVSHGTDTMSYTAAALSFSLTNLPIPIILVGSQKSSDRPSSDAPINLVGAITLATRLDYSGVFVSMHENLSDDVIACHLGTRVRKNHTSKRGAFESIDVSPIALVKDHEIQIKDFQSDLILNKRITDYGLQKNKFIAKPNFDPHVFLLKFYPGLDPKIIDNIQLLGYKILIIEGTGLGHVNKKFISHLKKSIDSGILVFMTSQCIWGKTRLTVYDTGRDLLSIGVIPLSNMLSETAVVKAMWLLANTEFKNIKTLMNVNYFNEISNITSIY